MQCSSRFVPSPHGTIPSLWLPRGRALAGGGAVSRIVNIADADVGSV